MRSAEKPSRAQDTELVTCEERGMSIRIVSAVLLCVACRSSHHEVGPDGGDAGSNGGDAAMSCPRVVPSGDHAHHVVISHPFDGSGNPSPQWEVLDLAADGTLSQPKITFQMGAATDGAVAFTPDGELAVAAQDDGSLGVVRLADDGTPSVIAAAYKGTSGWYASSAVMAPSGDHVYVLSQQTVDNGGGIYRIDLACDGTPSDVGRVVSTGMPGGLTFVPGADRALVAADQTGLFAWTEPTANPAPSQLTGFDPFGDGMAIVGAAALTADGKTYAVGDINQYETGGEGMNRLAIVPRSGDTLGSAAVVPINDPESLIASPFGDVVLSVSGYGNALYVLDTSGTGGAWAVRGQVTYTGAAPELPGAAIELSTGMLNGNVFVSELQGVRRVELRPNGSVVDDGRFTIGDGSGNDLQDIVGAIGVSP